MTCVHCGPLTFLLPSPTRGLAQPPVCSLQSYCDQHTLEQACHCQTCVVSESYVCAPGQSHRGGKALSTEVVTECQDTLDTRAMVTKFPMSEKSDSKLGRAILSEIPSKHKVI